jgi:hypothetical protein
MKARDYATRIAQHCGWKTSDDMKAAIRKYTVQIEPQYQQTTNTVTNCDIAVADVERSGEA